VAVDLISRSIGGIRSHIAAARGRDPATAGASSLEILLTWPGVQALLAYRLANFLHRSGMPLLPLGVSYVSRAITGIEIHPGAKIGPGLFIDHGSGVVIGETTEIGENVTLYQGVTLGGTGFQAGKRHPTIEDNVTIGSGAKLLGPIQVGHGAKIGANTVVVEDVPPRSTVVGNPGHPVRVEGRRVADGPDADWIHLPDPLQDAVKSLSARIKELERKVAELSGSKQPVVEEPGDEPKTGRSSAGG
jgi:serine O-acetyltransferase